jgi:hypothetical protein
MEVFSAEVEEGVPMSLSFQVGTYNNKPAIQIPIDWTNSMDQVANDMVIYYNGSVVNFVSNGIITNGIDIWNPQNQSGIYYTWYIG